MTIFFVWLLLAAFGYLLTAPLFKSAPDRGLGFAPWVGLIAIAYPSWLLGHTGFYQLSAISSWLILIVICALIVFLIKKKKISLADYHIKISYIFYHSSIWIFLYAIYVWFYGNNPAIEDIEKFPDLAMLFSAYRSEQMPPLNIFASGQIINYYYFGFYKVATLAHLSGTEPYEIFNPMKAVLLGSASSSMASVTILILDRLIQVKEKLLKQSLMLLGGLISFILAFLVGNFHTMYEQIILNSKNFWYPNATRYISNTIHEFPLYSFIIGDLHAHLIALPTAGLTLALVFLYSEKLSKTENHIKSILKQSYIYLVPLCFVYGMSYASNSWDIFTGLLLAGFLTWFILKEKSLFSYNTLLNTGLLSIIYVLGAIVLFLPFWVLFQPISSGLGHTPAAQASPTIQLMVIWVIHASFPVLFLCLEHSKEFVFRFLRVLCALGLGLILFMEYFYFKDIYSGHLRANTLFKIGLQIWLWFSVATSCYFIYIVGNQSKWSQHVRIGLATLFGVLMGSGLVYTKKAVTQYIEVNRSKGQQADGIDFMRIKYGEDYAVVRWLQDNEPEQATVLTVAGDSFSSDGIINAFTGNPTVITWVTHNWLWHGSNDKPMKPMTEMNKKTGIVDSVNSRVARVNAFYQSTSLEKSKEFIDLYKIKYVLVSDRERNKYKQLNENLIRQLGQLVFSVRNSNLYKVSDYGPN